MKKTYIPRKHYLQKTLPYIDKDIIKVFIGQRRVGKSYFLFQLMDVLAARGVQQSEIAYINKELSEFSHIRTAEDLLTYIKKKKTANKTLYVFIDEVQEIAGFERALQDLQARGGYDLYCTGSNANLLSSDLATLLRGRYIPIKIFSLSYDEFMLFHHKSDSNDTLFSYIKYGGLPYLIHLELTDEIAYDYLRAMCGTLLLKDVVERFNVRNVSFLERLVEYVADNVGSIVSAKKISDFLKSQKIKMSPNLVMNYLSHLSSAYILFRAPRIDVVGKKIFEINEKYYFSDLGLRHAVVGYRQTDINKIIENLSYLHLARAGYEVAVGKMKEKEIDFVAQRGGEKLYVQCAYHIESDDVRKREFGNLLSIEDNYPKIVVSLDDMAGGSVSGIAHMHLREFLLKAL